MQYNPKIHHRKSIRLKGYDYSQAGLYFVTICCQNRACLLGEIADGTMVLNNAGGMVQQVWDEIPVFYNGFNIHQFVVMPNHIHGIIEIVGAGPRACPDHACPDRADPNNNVLQNGQLRGKLQNGQPRGVATTTLGDVVHRYKTLTTKRYIDGVKINNWQRFDGKFWQRNYWEYIIRNEDEYQRIAQYILNNPMKWDMDKLNGRAGNQVMEPPPSYGQNIFYPKEEAWMV